MGLTGRGPPGEALYIRTERARFTAPVTPRPFRLGASPPVAGPSPWQSTGMDDSRYLECLSADYGDLRDAASSVELTAPVPSCPGRTVSHLVVHVAEGYLHETAIMRSGQVPEPWPPAGLAAEAPLALLGRGPADRRPRLGGLPPADARRGHQVRVPRLPDPLAGAALAGRRLM